MEFLILDFEGHSIINVFFKFQVNKKGRFVHVGLTSFTLADCSSPFPAVHSRTTYFLDWIKAALTSVQ